MTRIQQENHAEIVKMGYSSTESGLVELSIPKVNTFNSLILEDIKTGETVDLLGNSYYFEYDSNEDFESGRFIIYINQNTLANEEFSNNDLNIYNRNNNLCLDFNKEIKKHLDIIYKIITKISSENIDITETVMEKEKEEKIEFDKKENFNSDIKIEDNDVPEKITMPELADDEFLNQTAKE